MSDAVRERVDVAVGVVGLGHLAGKPVGRKPALPHQEAVDGDDKLGMGGG